MFRKYFFVLTCTLLTIFLSAVPIKSWPKEESKPLTIAYPEKHARNNPPFFNWKQDPSAAEYKIILKKGDWEKAWITSDNFYTPTKPLKKGNYTFQIFSLDPNQKELEKTEIKDLEIELDGMTLDIDFTGIKHNKKMIYMNPDVVKEIKNSEGLQKHYFERLKESVDKADPKWLDRPEPDPYPEGKFVWKYWNNMNETTGGIEQYVMRKAFIYQIAGEKKYAQQAIKPLMELASWNPRGSTSVASSDHAEWSSIHALAMGYDLLKEELTEEQRAVVKKALMTRCENVYNFLNPFMPKEIAAGLMNDPDNNHPWFTASALGIGGLALMDEEPRAREWASYAAQLYYGVFLPRGGKSGGWHEGLGYWAYTLFFVFQFSDVLKTTTDIDFYEHPWLQKTAFFKEYAHPPKGAYVPFGDCSHKPPTAFHKLVMMRLASRLNSDMCWKYVDAIEPPVKESRVPIALRWSARKKPGFFAKFNPFKKKDIIPKAFLFKDIGWAVSNTDLFDASKQFLFAVHCGPFFGRRFNHSHADQNHFVLTAGGDKLLWDSGLYDSYLSDHHRHFAATSMAHNTILVNGKGQQQYTAKTDGIIKNFEQKKDTLFIEADASNPMVYDGAVKTFVRNFEYKIGKSLKVQDKIKLPEPGQISWLLHSDYPIEFDTATNKLSIVGDHYRLEGTFSEKVTAKATKGFPIEPKKHKDWVQYHLELLSEENLTNWNPIMDVKIIKNDKKK